MSTAITIGEYSGCRSTSNRAIGIGRFYEETREGHLYFGATYDFKPISEKSIVISIFNGKEIEEDITEEMYQKLEKLDSITIKNDKEIYLERLQFYFSEKYKN